MSRISNILAIVASSLLTTACAAYTGVDTTPKISSKEVRRQKVTLTAEQKLLDDIVPLAPRQWQPGMTFVVTDPRVNLIFDAASDPVDTLGHGTALALVSAKPITSYTGREVVELRFSDGDGRTLIYRPSVQYTNFIESERFEVPFTVQQALIDSVASRLVGRRFYILPQRRLDADGNPVNGLRYQPVTITDVTLGNDVQPLQVWFDTADGSRQALMMTVGATSGALRNLNTLFAIDNPRRQHPEISDKNWQLITQSRVAPGMTPDECRLALGRPANVLHMATTMGPGEQWTYENGVYLVFIDGALVKYRQ